LALNALLETHQPLPGEEDVPLADLVQRVLARDVTVQHNVPAFDNSAMDGYAINGNTLDTWQVVQRITAGDQANTPLQPGQAARTFPGTPIPPGTTAVLMQENVQVAEDRISLNGVRPQLTKKGSDPISGDANAAKKGSDPISAITDGMNIRFKAEELREG